MTPEVKKTDPDGVDYGWIMQVTFVTAIFVGSPLVALLSLLVSLPSWSDRAEFAIRVGAVVWLLTLLSVYVYARRHRDRASEESPAGAVDEDTDREGKSAAEENSG